MVGSRGVLRECLVGGVGRGGTIGVLLRGPKMMFAGEYMEDGCGAVVETAR